MERVKEFFNEYTKVFNEFLENKESIYAVERLCELVAQALIDLAAMISSREKKSKPSSYRELLRFLADKLDLDKDYRDFLEGLAGFRNLLIHGYARIDRELEIKAFNDILSKLPRILELLDDYVGKDPCLDEVVDKIKRVLKEFNVEYAVIFGSLARSGCGRDVDLAVKFAKKPSSALELGRLVVRLADSIGVSEDKIDLVDLDNAPPGLLKTIIDEGVVVYGDVDKALTDLSKRYIMLLDYWETIRVTSRRMRAVNTSQPHSSS